MWASPIPGVCVARGSSFDQFGEELGKVRKPTAKVDGLVLEITRTPAYVLSCCPGPIDGWI